MDVLYAVSEADPFAKEGGLGEVAGAYPAAMAAQGVQVRGIMPLYGAIPEEYRRRMEFIISFPVKLALDTVFCGLYQMVGDQGVTWYFIENDRCFSRKTLYGYPDDDHRFAFFSKAVCLALKYLDWRPEILHCNDWQTALVPFYMRDYYARFLPSDPIKTVFTIHNVEFQGDFSYRTLTDVFGLSGALFAQGTLELEGNVNLMKGAIEMADCVTTVSPTYARELSAPDASGPLAQVIASHQVVGILNGIPKEIDPATNPLVHRPYDRDSLEEKVFNKLWMQERRGLVVREDAPVFGIVGRLMPRKGFDLVAQVLPEFLEKGCQLVLSGDGEPQIARLMQALGERYPRQVAILPYSDANALEIYAGADFLLMPSQEEPCGTAPMEAMRFGTVPVVRATGGLRDTVLPYDDLHPEGWGLVLEEYSAPALRDALVRALAVYGRPEVYAQLQRRCMARDFSWDGPARQYKALYGSLFSEKQA